MAERADLADAAVYRTAYGIAADVLEDEAALAEILQGRSEALARARLEALICRRLEVEPGDGQGETVREAVNDAIAGRPPRW